MGRKKEIITSDDILGKDAVDPAGSVLGGVTKVHVDRKSYKIVGITIDMGLMRPDLYVGINHVRSFGDDAVLLKKVPFPKFKGIKVLTAEGKVIGRVIDMIIFNSTIKEFTVANRRVLGKRLGIKYSDIKEIGESIILKKGFKHKEKK